MNEITRVGVDLAKRMIQLAGYTVPVGDGDSAIRAEGFDSALELAPTLRYDAATDTFTGGRLVDRFEQNSQELLTRLRVEHDRLEQLASRREREFAVNQVESAPIAIEATSGVQTSTAYVPIGVTPR